MLSLKFRFRPLVSDGQVRFGLEAVIYLIEADGHFVRKADFGIERNKWPQFSPKRRVLLM